MVISARTLCRSLRLTLRIDRSVPRRTTLGLTIFAKALVALVFLGPVMVAEVQAQTVYTGGKTGAYHSHFCPALSSALQRRQIDLTCEPTNGTADNMARVAAAPRNFGYGQLDVYALQAESFGGRQVLSRVRGDDVRECLFAVTKTKDLVNYGEVAVYASQLRFFLPPETSGSTNTFRYLSEIDPEGLGQAQDIVIEETTDAAIRSALSTEGGVALFVQFPDPNNARFKLVQELGGHIVPVIDRTILAQEVDGQQVYFAQETQVTNARWLRAGRKVVTACTPLIIFTGADEAIEDETDRRAHARVTDAIRRLRGQDLLPQAPLFSRILKRTKQVATAGVERLSQISDQARERARPILEQARESGRQLYERAKDGAQIMIDKARESGQPVTTTDGQ